MEALPQNMSNVTPGYGGFMAVTLDDVARMAGVSRATASRALSGDPNVREATRARVLAVAKTAGYRVNHAARSLARGRSGVLGLAVPSGSLIDDPYRAMLVSAVSEACNQRELGLMIWMTGEERGTRLIEMVHSGMVDGLFILSGSGEQLWLDELIDGPVPAVLLGSHARDLEPFQVDHDNDAGARLAADHLADLGHTRIATITGRLDHDAGERRLTTFVAQLAARGIELPSERIIEGRYDFDSGRLGLEPLLETGSTAVFVANDQMAAGLLWSCHQHGISVPDELSVMGYDDIVSAATMNPPLTTIRQDPDNMAALSIDLMLEVLADDEPADKSPVSPAELVVRSSTAPPKIL